MNGTRPLPPEKIEYKDLFVLRPIEPADVPQIAGALEASLRDLQPFMSWSHYLQGERFFLERVLNQRANYFKGVDYELGLFEKSSGEFLVYTGFYPTARINPNCLEIGFWTSSKHKDRGFATLATQMQIALIFEFFVADRIEITTNVDNRASRRVIEKCGFKLEGEMRNYYPVGTPQMYTNNYTHERRTLLFSLIPQDKAGLGWYSQMVEDLTLFPLLSPPVKLSAFSEKTLV